MSVSTTRKLISQRHPILYFLAVWYRRCLRYKKWYLGKQIFATGKREAPLPFRVKKHSSILLRKLGDADMQLQINKVTNLKIAVPKLDHILIKPGETFSFCKLVGRPTVEKGYVMGMELSFGKARPGIGGGICQLANMIHWLVLHSDLIVTERAQHSFDPFPDEGRVLPFGSGAAIFYNYIDYQFFNPTDMTFQLCLEVKEHTLEGSLRVSKLPKYSYHIEERKHQFLQQGGMYFRTNEIWQLKYDKHSGNLHSETLVTRNFARVTYTPPHIDGIVE